MKVNFCKFYLTVAVFQKARKTNEAFIGSIIKNFVVMTLEISTQLLQNQLIEGWDQSI